jgi:hypothetical protein
MKEFRPEINRVQKITMDVFVLETDEELVLKTIEFTQLPDISIVGIDDHLPLHMDDILNNRSFELKNGLDVKFDYALVDVKPTNDRDEEMSVEIIKANLYDGYYCPVCKKQQKDTYKNRREGCYCERCGQKLAPFGG